MSQGNWAPERVRRNFRIDLGAGILGAAMFGFVVPFMPVVVRRMGGSEFEVSLVIASAFIGHLASPFLAYALARLPSVFAVAVTSTASRGLFVVGALLAPSTLVLSLVYVGFWVFLLANIAAYTSVMNGIYPDDQRATAMGRVRVGANLAAVIAATLGGALLQLWADPIPVLAGAAAISVLGGISFGAIRLDERPDRPRLVPPYRLMPMALADRAFRRFLFSFTVMGFGNLMGFTLYPLLLVDRFDAPNAFVGAYTALSSVAMMAGYLFWGRLIDRGSSLGLTLVSSTVLLGMPLVYLFAPSAVFVLPAAVIHGFTFAAGDLTFFTNLVQLAPQGKAEDYMAAQSFALGLRGTVAPFAASALLVATNAEVVLTVVIAMVVTGLIILRGVERRLAPRTERRVAEAV